VGGGDPGEPLDDPHAAIDRIAHTVTTDTIRLWAERLTTGTWHLRMTNALVRPRSSRRSGQ
jgi:hypothetical protein